jgi:hypothetical protein
MSKKFVLYNFLIAANIVLGLSYGTDDHSLRDELGYCLQLANSCKICILNINLIMIMAM